MQRVGDEAHDVRQSHKDDDANRSAKSAPVRLIKRVHLIILRRNGIKSGQRDWLARVKL